MRGTKRALAIVAFTLVSCSTQVVPASTPTSNTTSLRIYATTAALPLLNDLITEYVKANPIIAFDSQGGNYQTVLNALLAGETAYFVTSHLPGDSPLWAAPLGQDGIAIIVHPANNVAGLTTEQLRRIYQGHVANWQEVGGDDRELIVISRENGSGTRAEFERLVMGERRTTQSAQIAPSSAAMVASVARQPGSIGYVSIAYLDSRTRAVPVDGIALTPDTVFDNEYPLRSTLYIAGLAEPEEHYLYFIAWAQSPEGQAVIARRYAPMLRP
ncbi:MAG: phosphate ABC transporter substrate-binding protein [Chloroflexi bacterium]|nr:phosphate ABC transporter substrate-binding protein [Chloroflexota bacterium]